MMLPKRHHMNMSNFPADRPRAPKALLIKTRIPYAYIEETGLYGVIRLLKMGSGPPVCFGQVGRQCLRFSAPRLCQFRIGTSSHPQEGSQGRAPAFSGALRCQHPSSKHLGSGTAAFHRSQRQQHGRDSWQVWVKAPALRRIQHLQHWDSPQVRNPLLL